MENATKALLIAGGVLIAILIITLFVAVLQNTGKVSKRYDVSISSEQIATFNSNFTKYLGQDLTIHEVVTICNFATDNNVKVINRKKAEDIKNDEPNKKYRIKINSYGSNGYISEIGF